MGSALCLVDIGLLRHASGFIHVDLFAVGVATALVFFLWLRILDEHKDAAQQSGFNGATTEKWQVSFGSNTQNSTLMNNLSHGSVGWNQQSLTFTAQSATDVLSFVAVGTPNGVPPFVLLDGVTVSATPEPATFALIGLGLIGLPMLGRFRRTES